MLYCRCILLVPKPHSCIIMTFTSVVINIYNALFNWQLRCVLHSSAGITSTICALQKEAGSSECVLHFTIQSMCENLEIMPHFLLRTYMGCIQFADAIFLPVPPIMVKLYNRCSCGHYTLYHASLSRLCVRMIRVAFIFDCENGILVFLPFLVHV